ncbi:acetyl-CoA carboxylase alpha subunit [Desulfovibrio sp. X2]|uniref:acetyl-CoA carboxylase carboxyl transferase subunit alpha/beta n=1 Tax=Desulfovibrio sp. X2 TaxID=941449 RepID=UPI000358A7E9|nr:acetyl-CoA carboxylase carboxyl transferase subunit alpha/beta [Desulfovibrio sp. X2]EPR37338.1 acetyl-CoA carboxylase alpha subunit [Desulfovibrio sp. X2]
MELDNRIRLLQERLGYIRDIFGDKENANIKLLQARLDEFLAHSRGMDVSEQMRHMAQLEDLFFFLEKKLDAQLTPMDRVRIVRHPMRVCLKDILENVYDNYTEIGGQDEYSIDPSMLIARAYITRRVGKKVMHQPVMVIGQEKGHGQEFRNGGSVKPWGNAKALHYMKVAEMENIPIHAYVFTPGSYPIEDYPGAAQQIARNLFEMSELRVPFVAAISEGGSGGAEAIALSDMRLMFSHGYYSVISPEGAAAIEAKTRQGERVAPELIEKCARQLKITAEDNLRMGYVDRVVTEPPLGARVDHYDFYKTLRNEMINATNQVVLQVKGMKLFRSLALNSRLADGDKAPMDAEEVYVSWHLSSKARDSLVWKRHQKFRALAQSAYLDKRSVSEKFMARFQDAAWAVNSFFRYEFLRKHHRKIQRLREELEAEAHLVRNKVGKPVRAMLDKIGGGKPSTVSEEAKSSLTQLSKWDEGEQQGGKWAYISPKAKEDRTVTCPNSETHGCLDLWAPDLFGEYAGVCGYCGHHFTMEYQWYLYNVFDQDSIFEFNGQIESGNPLSYEGFDQRVEQAKKKTGLRSACMTFEARIENVNLVVAMLVAPFRGGSVGAAEGEKFIRAVERAKKKHYPFLAYVHGTAGIRIQEGTNGVIQMPRCTMAVHRYIEDGGLYVVLYDTNSYAGPVASFLGCSPYQFAIRSANIGFAGPGVIKETTGVDIPPDYHQAHQALSRGHIQGIWDRREARKNLYQALLTMGGRNLYYR